LRKKWGDGAKVLGAWAILQFSKEDGKYVFIQEGVRTAMV
jgi:hypothetical protein